MESLKPGKPPPRKAAEVNMERLNLGFRVSGLGVRI